MNQPRIATVADFERAQSAYLATLKDDRGMPIGRILAGIFHALWSRFPGHLSLIAAIALTFLVCRFGLAVEVPDRIVAAIVQVESGCEWRGIGDVRGKWSRGADGEVSPFQISPAALSDMGVTNASRVHRDTVWAESLARLWLSRCFDRHGNWPEAVAAYNAGSRYRSRSARDYACRVIALAESTAN